MVRTLLLNPLLTLDSDHSPMNNTQCQSCSPDKLGQFFYLPAKLINICTLMQSELILNVISLNTHQEHEQ